MTMPYHKGAKRLHAKPHYSAACLPYRGKRRVPRPRPVNYEVTQWLNFNYDYSVNTTSFITFSLAQLPPGVYAAYALIFDEYQIEKVTVRVGVQDGAVPAQNPPNLIVPPTYDVIMAPVYAPSTSQNFEALLANNNKQHQKYINAQSGNNTMDYTIYPRVALATNSIKGTATLPQACKRSWLAFTGDTTEEAAHYGLLIRVGQVNGNQGIVNLKVKFHLKLRSF